MELKIRPLKKSPGQLGLVSPNRSTETSSVKVTIANQLSGR